MTTDELQELEDMYNQKYSELLEKREADIVVEDEFSYISFKNWLELFFYTNPVYDDEIWKFMDAQYDALWYNL